MTMMRNTRKGALAEGVFTSSPLELGEAWPLLLWVIYTTNEARFQDFWMGILQL
jgi:hypothetical protein